ncbi:MAG TPA: hypothetical protein VNM87_10360 [Candidatus Udaeobacter sp.]|nr:hypothetical protein [Candidatus Udaeobacter sp.]
MRVHRILFTVACSGLMALALSGCGQDQATDPESSSTTDESALRTMMDEEGTYFDGGESVSDGQVGVGGSSPRSPSGAPIESFYFVREILSRDIRRSVEIEAPNGERAIAHVSTTARLRGIFHLFVDDPDNIYLPGMIDKRLNAVAQHNATFVQAFRPENDRRRGWRLAELSGTEVVSDPTTKDIVSVEIVSRSVNRTITDPLALVSVRELPTFQAGEAVTLRVRTTDPTDFVFLHSGLFKDEFHPVGDGLYEGTWTVGERRGVRRVAVDVIDKETLFDDEAPYDSVAWVLHYRVAGEVREGFEVGD